MDNEAWRRGRKRPTMSPSAPMDEQDRVSETDERDTPLDDDPVWQQAMDWLMRLRDAPDSMELRRACRVGQQEALALPTARWRAPPRPRGRCSRP